MFALHHDSGSFPSVVASVNHWPCYSKHCSRWWWCFGWTVFFDPIQGWNSNASEEKMAASLPSTLVAPETQGISLVRSVSLRSQAYSLIRSMPAVWQLHFVSSIGFLEISMEMGPSAFINDVNVNADTKCYNLLWLFHRCKEPKFFTWLSFVMTNKRRQNSIDICHVYDTQWGKSALALQQSSKLCLHLATSITHHKPHYPFTRSILQPNENPKPPNQSTLPKDLPLLPRLLSIPEQQRSRTILHLSLLRRSATNQQPTYDFW